MLCCSIFFCFCNMKKRIFNVILVFFALALTIAALAYIGGKYPGFTVCPVKRILRLSCPGCGMTSAVLSLLKLDFSSAFKYNLMFIPILGYIAFVFVQFVVRYIKNGSKDFLPKPEWVNVLFLVFIIVWTVVRNIVHI